MPNPWNQSRNFFTFAKQQFPALIDCKCKYNYFVEVFSLRKTDNSLFFFTKNIQLTWQPEQQRSRGVLTSYFLSLEHLVLKINTWEKLQNLFRKISQLYMISHKQTIQCYIKSRWKHTKWFLVLLVKNKHLMFVSNLSAEPMCYSIETQFFHFAVVNSIFIELVIHLSSIYLSVLRHGRLNQVSLLLQLLSFSQWASCPRPLEDQPINRECRHNEGRIILLYHKYISSEPPVFKSQRYRVGSLLVCKKSAQLNDSFLRYSRF